MKKIFQKARLTTTLLVGVALSVSTMVAPRPAQADGGLAIVAGGAFLMGAILHSGHFKTKSRSLVTQTVTSPSSGSLATSAIVYSLEPPVLFRQVLASPVDVAQAALAPAPVAQSAAVTGTVPTGVYLY